MNLVAPAPASADTDPAPAAVLWQGGLTPPADLPDSLVSRALPTAESPAVRAPRFMVASAHPLASEAGAKILAAGGNAADAALAVQAMLALVEPQNSGPGGGCFILYHDAEADSLHAIDGREELPSAGTPDMFLDAQGEPLPELFSGGLPVGVPGTIAAMSLLHGRHGRLYLGEVLAPAIGLAEAGFPVSAELARAIRSQAERLRRFPASRALYFDEGGEPLAEGAVLRNPELGQFFRLWAAEPTGRFFYIEEVAAALVAAVQGAPFRPGLMTVADMAGYRAVERAPIVGSYRGRKLAVMPPPTSGGITLLEILGILETRAPLAGDIREPGVLVEHLDRLARASRLAFADRGRYLGDPDWSPEISMGELLDPLYLVSRAREAFAPDADLSTSAAAASFPGGQTTHFSIVAGDGGMLSCTSTIETTFGSAMVVPEYGFCLNNELTDFNWQQSDPLQPNDAEGGRRERVAVLGEPAGWGGKRPRSSMCPVIVYDENGRPEMALGSPGGSRIIGTVASALLLLLDYDLDLQAALAFPRLHCRNAPLEIETFGWNREVVAAAMRERGWEIAPLDYWPRLQGNVNAVRVLPDGTREGASDPRQGGQPLGG